MTFLFRPVGASLDDLLSPSLPVPLYNDIIFLWLHNCRLLPPLCRSLHVIRVVQGFLRRHDGTIYHSSPLPVTAIDPPFANKGRGIILFILI